MPPPCAGSATAPRSSRSAAIRAVGPVANAMVEVASKGSGDLYGIGIDSNIVTASIKALISGVNRLGAVARVEQAA